MTPAAQPKNPEKGIHPQENPLNQPLNATSK
jgi:hypothetical protein